MVAGVNGMRFWMAGGETRDFAEIGATTASTGWTVTCDTTSPLTANSTYSYRFVSAGTPSGAGGYAEWDMQNGAKFYTAGASYSYAATTSVGVSHNGVSGMFNTPPVNSTPYLSRAYLRWYFKLNAVPASGSYVHEMFGLYNSSSSRQLSWVISTGGQFAVEGRTFFTPSVGTTYRVEVEIIRLGSPYVAANDASVNTKVFVGNSTTVSSQYSSAKTGMDNIRKIRIGATVNIFQQAGYEIAIDDIAINTSYDWAGTGLHTRWCGPASMFWEQDLTAGTYQEWTSSSGSHTGDIESNTGFLAVDNTDYVSSTNSLPMRESFHIPAYAPPSSTNTIKTMCLYMRYNSDSSNGFYHEQGILDGSGNLLTANIAAQGSELPMFAIVDQQYGGGALTNAYYAAAETFMRRHTNLVGINFKNCCYQLIVVEDDLAVSSFDPNTWDGGANAGQVT